MRHAPEEQLDLGLHRELDKLGKFGVRLRLNFASTMDELGVNTFLSSLLTQIARNCLADGADMIGHIKAHLETKKGNFKGSVLDSKAGARVEGAMSGKTGHGKLTLNVIVHGIMDERVQTVTMRTLLEFSKLMDFKFNALKSYSDKSRRRNTHG